MLRASVVLAVSFAHAGLAASPAPSSVALLPVVGSDLAADELAAIDPVFLAEAQRRLGPALLDDAAMRQRLITAAGKGLACRRTTEECRVQLGIVLGVERVLAPSVAGGDGEVQATLEEVDVAAAKATRRARAALSVPVAENAVAALFDALDAPEATQLVAAAAPAAAIAAPPSADAGPGLLPVVGLAAGGGLVAVGAVLAGVGALPWFTYAAARDRLADLETAVGDDAAALASQGAAIDAARAEATSASAGWSTWGIAVVVIGAVAAGAGLGLAGASGAWLLTE